MAISITASYILLGIIAAVFVGFSVMIALYQLIYWSDKQEVWKTIFPRIVIGISIFMTVFTPILIPFDAAITFLTPNLKFMELVWQIFVYSNMVLAFIVLPLLFFIQDIRIEEKQSCFKVYFFAILQLLIFLAVIFIITIILYFTIGNAEIPTILVDASAIQGKLGYVLDIALTDEIKPGESERTLFLLPLNFQTYLFAIVSFLGSIFFIVFLGVGTAALPVDLIKQFINRPRAMSTQELLKFKKEFTAKAMKILNQIDTIYVKLSVKQPRSTMLREIRQGSDKNLFTGNKNLLKQAILLERTAQELFQNYTEIIAMNMKETANPLKFYLILVLGILVSIFSVILAVQYILIVIYQFAPQVFKFKFNSVFFLSQICLLAQDSIGVPLISSVIFAAVAFFIILCFLKGVAKFGFRFILFVSIHPLQKGLTQISSFLFNCSIMLIGILSSLQFFTIIFRSFTYGSAADILFNSGVSNIQYLHYWFKFQYAILVGVMVVSFFLSMFFKLKKVDQQMEDLLNGKLEKQIKKKGKGKLSV